MSRQGSFCHQLLRNLSCKRRFEAAPYVDLGKLFLFKLHVIAQLIAFPREIRLFGVGLRTDETYSPVAIDMAPATNPATPATRTAFFVAAAAATPTIKLAVERMPSLAPSTAARSQPMRFTR